MDNLKSIVADLQSKNYAKVSHLFKYLPIGQLESAFREIEAGTKETPYVSRLLLDLDKMDISLKLLDDDIYIVSTPDHNEAAANLHTAINILTEYFSKYQTI